MNPVHNTQPSETPLASKIVAAVLAWQQQVPADASLAECESAAQQLAQHLAQMALSQQLATRQAATTAEKSLPCPCGKRQYLRRQQPRRLRTLVGEVRYVRPYYYCQACGAGRAPFDQALGQDARDVTAGVVRLGAEFSAHVSFGAAARLLEKANPAVALSDRQVETIAEAVGAQAAAAQQQAVRQAAQTPLAPAPHPHLRLVGAPAPEPRTWIIEMDGIHAPLRDGTRQEVKCGLVYRHDQRVQISKDRGLLLHKLRCAVRGGVEDFRATLWAQLIAAGVRQSDHLVVLGDGAAWIDETVAELFPRARRILDFFHVAEHLWEVAHARFGEGAQAAKTWMSAKLEQLKRGGWRAVCRALNQLRLTGAGAQKRQETVSYLRRHGTHLAYDQYQAEGLPIGSGAIEGTCKHVVASRCKQAGMRWSEAGLDAVLALRCRVLNEQLDSLLPPPKLKLVWESAVIL